MLGGASMGVEEGGIGGGDGVVNGVRVVVGEGERVVVVGDGGIVGKRKARDGGGVGGVWGGGWGGWRGSCGGRR